jgi:hypothetical protein
MLAVAVPFAMAGGTTCIVPASVGIETRAAAGGTHLPAKVVIERTTVADGSAMDIEAEKDKNMPVVDPASVVALLPTWRMQMAAAMQSW